MKLGKIQKAWISDLRKYPERQIEGKLGWFEPNGEIKACCLGQGLLTLCEMRGVKPILVQDTIYTQLLCDCDHGIKDYDYPVSSFKELGLRDDRAKFKDAVASSYFERETKRDYYHSLSQMNDGGLSWLEIADYIEVNPENVFIHSL